MAPKLLAALIDAGYCNLCRAHGILGSEPTDDNSLLKTIEDIEMHALILERIMIDN